MAQALKGLKAIVTGGASGIGAATVAALRDAGAGVAILDRDPVADASDVVALQCDIGIDESVRAAVTAAAAALGGIDILVNNAGIGSQGRVQDHADEDWHTVLNVNVVGTARVCKAAWPYLVQSAAAAIVNVSSVAATAGLPQRAIYSASKGAVSALTRAMAADGMPDGVRVNAVNPGTADTPWVARLLASAEDPDAERTALAARQPHGRLVTPEEVAAAIVYLASPSAASTTGVELAVDGGMAGLRLRARN